MALVNIGPNISRIYTQLQSCVSLYAHAYEDGTANKFRNVGNKIFDAGEITQKTQNGIQHTAKVRKQAGKLFIYIITYMAYTAPLMEGTISHNPLNVGW